MFKNLSLVPCLSPPFLYVKEAFLHHLTLTPQTEMKAPEDVTPYKAPALWQRFKNYSFDGAGSLRRLEFLMVTITE